MSQVITEFFEANIEGRNEATIPGRIEAKEKFVFDQEVPDPIEDLALTIEWSDDKREVINALYTASNTPHPQIIDAVYAGLSQRGTIVRKAWQTNSYKLPVRTVAAKVLSRWVKDVFTTVPEEQLNQYIELGIQHLQSEREKQVLTRRMTEKVNLQDIAKDLHISPCHALNLQNSAERRVVSFVARKAYGDNLRPAILNGIEQQLEFIIDSKIKAHNSKMKTQNPVF